MKEYFVIGAAVIGIGAIAFLNMQNRAPSPFDAGAYDPLGLGVNNGNYADFITGVYDSDVGHAAAETPVAFGGGALPPSITGTQTPTTNDSFWTNLQNALKSTVNPPLSVSSGEQGLISSPVAPNPSNPSIMPISDPTPPRPLAKLGGSTLQRTYNVL